MAVLPLFLMKKNEEKIIMDFLSRGMNLISIGVGAFGAVWIIWGIIVLATGLNETNGHSIRDGFLRAIAGALIVAAAAWLTQVDVSFA